MAEERLKALVAAAGEAAAGMGKVAADKPDQAPVQTDARTFRGLVAMLNGLSEEARQRDERVCGLTAKLHRIARLEVRDAAQLIERGDWKKLTAELQAIAEEAVGGGASAARR